MSYSYKHRESSNVCIVHDDETGLPVATVVCEEDAQEIVAALNLVAELEYRHPGLITEGYVDEDAVVDTIRECVEFYNAGTNGVKTWRLKECERRHNSLL
jgi:hypothetical protein